MYVIKVFVLVTHYFLKLGCRRFEASIKKLRSIFVPGSSLVCDISCTFGVLNRLPDETGQDDASGNIPARMFTAFCLYPVYGPTFTSEE